MNLTDWMKKYDVTDEKLAKFVGVSRPYISRVRAGNVNLSLEKALKIQAFTRQEVDLEQLLPVHARPGFKRPAPPTKPPKTVRRRPGRRASTQPATA